VADEKPSERERAPAAPRPWLLAAPVPHGEWRCLLYLWTFGPHWRPGDPLPATGEVRVWPCRRTMARELGQPFDTVKSWLRGLTASGWIRRDGNVIQLAVEVPIPAWVEEAKGRRRVSAVSTEAAGDDLDEGGGRLQTRAAPNPGGVGRHPGRAAPNPGGSKPGGGGTPPGEGGSKPGGRAEPHPQIMHGSSIDPPEILQQNAHARATTTAQRPTPTTTQTPHRPQPTEHPEQRPQPDPQLATAPPPTATIPDDTPQARHAAIRQSQGWDRKPTASTRPEPPAIPPEVLAKLDAWSGRVRWQHELENREWMRCLAEAVHREQLDGVAVVGLLALHEAERKRLDEAGTRHEAESTGKFPKRHTLWWAYGTHGKTASAWVSRTLVEVEKRRNAVKKPVMVGNTYDPCSIEWEQREAELERERELQRQAERPRRGE
jgi:hypothetical protein